MSVNINDSSRFGESTRPVFASVHDAVAQFGNQASWNELYKAGMDPWSTGSAAMTLKAGQKFIPSSGRFLVPGCGDGHDVFLLAENKDRTVVGLDLAPVVVLKSQKIQTEKYQSRSNILFKQGDYFEEKETYEFLFDHTFMVALPPDWRSRWALKTAELVEKGGLLMTSMFPLYDDLPADMTGPPHPVSLKAYHDILDAHFDLVEMESLTLPPPMAARGWKAAVGVWKRK